MIRFKLTSIEKKELCWFLIKHVLADENEEFKYFYTGVRHSPVGDRQICIGYKGGSYGFTYTCTLLKPICKILKAHRAEIESIKQPITSHYLCTVGKDKEWF